MESTLLVALALVLGTTTAIQLLLISAIGRQKRPDEGTAVSVTGTMFGLGRYWCWGAHRTRAEFARRSWRDVDPRGIVLAAAFLLVGVARGLPAAYGLTGLNAIISLLAIAFGVPRVGVALFFSAFTLGSVASALALDHVGAFGSARRRITGRRAIGVAVAAAGVVAVRVAS